MQNEAVCSWLMDVADISIRIQVARELRKETKLAEQLKPQLMESTEVKRWLFNLKPQTPPQTYFMEHGSCDYHLENALMKLIFLGLDGSEPELLDALSYYFDRLLSPEKSKNYFGVVKEETVHYRSGTRFHTILAANLISAAGVHIKPVDDYMRGSLREMSDFAKKGCYDLYLSEEERKRLKGVPKVWSNRKYFLRPELTHTYGFSYPLIYDLIGLQGVLNVKEEQTETQIEAVLNYLCTDTFHDQVEDGYGILVEEDGTYHAMGWTPKFPGWKTLPSTEGLCMSELMFFTLFASKYRKVRETKWFQNFLVLTECYRDQEGHYCFPASWLPEKKGYAVNGSHMSFGENRRKKSYREIESTFFMQMILREVSE